MELIKKWNKLPIETKLAFFGIGLTIISILPIIGIFFNKLPINNIRAVLGFIKFTFFHNPILFFPLLFLSLIIILIILRQKISRHLTVFICCGAINSILTFYYMDSDSLKNQYIKRINNEIIKYDYSKAYEYSYTYNKLSDGKIEYTNRILANKFYAKRAIKNQLENCNDTTSLYYKELSLMLKAFEK